MTRARSLAVALICVLFATGVANASWYDDYEAGYKAARAGNWALVVDKMNKAIAANPKEDNKARTYGAIFINYHPYYYRGVANLNLGRFDQAIADLEKTTGPGPVDLGSIEQLIKNAKAQSEEPAVASTPTPTPTPSRPVPVPVPTAPVLDGALRSQAQAGIRQARERLDAARARRAAGSALDNAIAQLADANTRFNTAKSNDDLRAAIAAADNAALYADSAAAPQVATTTPTPSRPVTPAPIQTRADAGAAVALADSSSRLRSALESYFAGEFGDAARAFQQLTNDMPRNGWIWAFLGASQYSQYAFEADDTYKEAAIKSFQRARKLGFGKNGLPARYFSKRIQKAFASTPG
jgi:tetratricopeptide (TPR) repeat protein